MKWPNFKINAWWNDMIMKQLVDKMTIIAQWNDMLMKQLVNEMSKVIKKQISWQSTDTPRCKHNCNSNKTSVRQSYKTFLSRPEMVV